MSVRALLNLASTRLSVLPLAVLYLTERCNSKCITCDYWQTGTTDMALDLALRLARELPELGCQEVLLSGGEPLFHPEWQAILEAMAAAGLRVTLVSNGLLVPKYADTVATTVAELVLSLDGARPETYQAIRGVNGLEVVLEGAREMVRRGVPVVFRCTLQHGNFREIPELVELSRDIGARLSFLAVDTTTGEAFAREGDWQRDMALSQDDCDELPRVIRAAMRTGSFDHVDGGATSLFRLQRYFRAALGLETWPEVRCNAPRFSVVVEPDGRLRPCYFLPEGGRIGEGPLRDTINAEGLRNLREEQRAGRRGECERCVCWMRKGPKAILGLS